MTAKKNKNKINLLPQEEFDSSTLGRVLAWLLSGFRVIVIGVEIVVMVAFLSRFWLDAKNSDLNDEIKQKEAQILASKEFEQDFRDTQNKLSILSEMVANEGEATVYLKTIPTTMPSDIFLSSLTINPDGVSIGGQAFSEQSIAQFITNLEATGTFESVDLVSVDTSPSEQSLIAFSLKLFGEGQDTLIN